MLPKFMSPFKAEEEEEAQEEKQMMKMKKKNKKQNNSRRSCQTSMDMIGLRLVTHITNSQTKSNNSNVVVKSAILRIGNNINGTNTSDLEMCFLKNCSLCNKKLNHDQDIYMYRGDQGFCSVECRNRQIARDEMRELEASTKQRAKSSSHCYRNCWNDARRHETRLILEDLRRHRLQSKAIPENHWAIVS